MEENYKENFFKVIILLTKTSWLYRQTNQPIKDDTDKNTRKKKNIPDKHS